MNKENIEISGFDLQRTLTSGRLGIPDKDGVETDLEQIRVDYRALGVTGASLRRIVEGLSEDFYNADRAGQFHCSSRIADVARNIGQAANNPPK